MFRKSLVWVMVLGIVLTISSGALAFEFFGMQILGETITKYGLQIVDQSYAKDAFSKVVRN